MQEQELYDKYKHGRHWENHPTIYAERFLSFLKKVGFSGLLVDVGCDTGRDVNVFHNNGFETLGIDYDSELTKEARSKYPNLNFDEQNVENLEFGDNSVSAFFMINVIHYVKKEKALSEICRSLKSGGYLYIHFNITIIDEEGSVDYEQKEKDILNLLDNFKVIEKKTFERVDLLPKKHTHKIMELILQK